MKTNNIKPVARLRRKTGSEATKEERIPRHKQNKPLLIHNKQQNNLTLSYSWDKCFPSVITGVVGKWNGNLNLVVGYKLPMQATTSLEWVGVLSWPSPPTPQDISLIHRVLWSRTTRNRNRRPKMCLLGIVLRDWRYHIKGRGGGSRSIIGV